MQEVSFFVPGVPVPQGSKNAGVRNGRAFMYEANKKHKPWRKQIQDAAEQYRGAFAGETPVHIEETYVFERPPSVKPSKRPHMCVKPDLDKLERSTGDSVSAAKVWQDDSRVVSRFSQKLYEDETHLPLGAHITIREVTE